MAQARSSTMFSVAFQRLVLAGVAAMVVGVATAAPPPVKLPDAGRGKAVFNARCASCHGGDLRGTDHGVELTGEEFNEKWKGRAADLLAYIATNMPPGQADTLSDAEHRAAAGYVLAFNGRAAEIAGMGGGGETPIAKVVSEGEQVWRPAASGFQNRTVENVAPVTEAMLTKPNDADWLSWRRTRDGQGHSPLKQITARNVGKLRLAWTISMAAGISEATPLVHDGIMYLPNPAGVIQALDASTGDIIWEYRYRAPNHEPPPRNFVRNIAMFGDRLFMTTFDAALVAIDMRSGKQLWRTEKAKYEEGFFHTSGPIIADGVVVSGINGCERFKSESCFVSGHDPETGRQLWKTPTIAQPGDRGDPSWGNTPLEFRAGGDSWIPGSYDAALKTFYVGTAQAKPWASASRRMTTKDAALYTNSTLALDPRSGAMKWYFQHVPGETLDMDAVFERVLIDRGGRSLLLTVGKDGLLWKLDRTDGRFLGVVETVHQDIYAEIDHDTGRLAYRHDIIAMKQGDKVPMCPSSNGGHDWQAMAYDPAVNAVFIPLLQECGGIAPGNVEFAPGGGGHGATWTPSRPMPGTSGYGRFAAFDVDTLKQRWAVEQRVPFTSAALSTAGGLVFIGDMDRYFRAYDARSGKQLWQTRLGAAAHGFPISFAAGGKQYVAVPSGEMYAFAITAANIGGVYQPEGGNALYVFELP